MTEPTDANFQAALPKGWTVAALPHDGRGYIMQARHPRYGVVQIGPKLRRVPRDVQLLAERVRDVEAPPLTYQQWLAAGERGGFVQPEPPPDDAEPATTALTHALRLLAVCIDRGDVDASDVAQALFVGGGYTVDCPVAMASNYGRGVSELYLALDNAARYYGYALQSVNGVEG